ncbi:MAG: flavodoxin [Bacteroidales bacterium]|nr:flavodoxin [Bacteroidales bacterium]MCF8345181.1 flavodoxin [Bacteroidales bacterium]MCF8350234.1 flavodoxin [Bacteroidales bacterium]MCF8375821.1 flavodoxin [Bacteroidales bacterium]MCF8401747.1 flavodoxin [Bacteroidales bacterium]
MAKIGIFYGSSTGNTEFIAEKIEKHLSDHDVELFNVDSASKEDVEKCDYLILGTSTWGVGDLQDDWESFLKVLLKTDISKKKTALFGLGDQEVYAESFVDGMGVLYNALKGNTQFVGQWPVSGYRFEDSTAVKNKEFVGLPIDHDNEPNLSEKRVEQWVDMLKREIK